MKKYLNYFYNIKVETIHKYELKYMFDFEGARYIFEEVSYSENELEEINKMAIKLLENNIPVHMFMLNKFANFITYIDNKKYILMRVITEKNKIGMDEINAFNCAVHVGTCKWKKLWIEKIDYYDLMELEIKQKNILLKAAYNYNRAITETGICLLNEKNVHTLYICHKRINNNPLDFYHPFNLIIDQKNREYAEYIKYLFFTSSNYKDIVKIIESIFSSFSNYEKSNVFIRLLHNTYFFDEYAKYLDNVLENKKIDNIIKKTKEYEDFLLYIYNNYIFEILLH